MSNQNQVAKQEESTSTRFMNLVVAEFKGSTGEVALTNFQKRLAQNYFMVADTALRTAEEKRQRKTGDYQGKTPVVWANVNMELLAQQVVSAARVGWDPMQNNHVSLIPFKDNASNTYKMTFMPGYRGLELRATKYGLEVPAVTVELVYTKDKFKSYKKNRDNKVESYDFEIVDDFDRGEIKGGFYYHDYKSNPEKNKVVTFNMKDIEKRKPKYASAEFWGGEKTVYKNGKAAGKEKIEGWFDKMCWKTICRAAYNDITIDSQKIDDDFLRLKQTENDFAQAEVDQEIAENANKQVIDIDYEEAEFTEPDQVPEPKAEPAPKQDKKQEPKPEEPPAQEFGDDSPPF